MIYKRNQSSKLGGACIREGAFIGDNTVIGVYRQIWVIYIHSYDIFIFLRYRFKNTIVLQKINHISISPGPWP